MPLLNSTIIKLNEITTMVEDKSALTPENELFIKQIFSELNKNGEHFGLKIRGDSMIEAGINDGDTVIIKKSSTADNGQIAVVLIDNEEATLKRIRKKGNTIALESANRKYGTKIYSSKRIKIQGKLTSLYRNFN